MNDIPDKILAKKFEISSDRVEFKERYDLRHLMNDFHDIARTQATLDGKDSAIIGEKTNAVWQATRGRTGVL